MLFDFEVVDINSFFKIFQKTCTNGCFYHLPVNIWKKLMKWVYKNGTVTTQSLMSAPAFVLPSNAFNVFEQLYEVIRNTCDIAAGIALYFLEDTYSAEMLRIAYNYSP